MTTRDPSTLRIDDQVIRALYSELADKRHQWTNESEVRGGWVKALEHSLDITFGTERNFNDASRNQAIFEFKNKGLFRGRTTSPAFKNAIWSRLSPYILAKSEREGIPPEEYVGIAIDGDHICIARFDNGEIVPGELIPLSESSVRKVAHACLDSDWRALTADNLIEDFGLHSDCARTLMGGLLYELETQMTSGQTNTTLMLFEEWRSIYGQVADLSIAQLEDAVSQIPFTANIPNHGDRIATILFAIHTYNSFVIKVLAADIIQKHKFATYGNFSERILMIESDEELLQTLATDIEQGNFFSTALIKGFVDDALFSWYTNTCISSAGKQRIALGIRVLLEQLSLYRVDKLGPAQSQDLLRNFYQALVPTMLRKTLGEFYTPHWLVELACDRASVDDWTAIRVLDPTCGSGAFLLEVVNRKRRSAEEQGFSDRELLTHILETVWGFDLNPLAVQTARVNLLIAISDLIAAADEPVELPVLLADAVYSPARYPRDESAVLEYDLGSNRANLKVALPAALVADRARLERIFRIMAEQLDAHNAYEQVEDAILECELLEADQAMQWRDALADTYQQVLNLHTSSWNGIWFQVIRQFFWPAIAGEFDLIVGNPPWVRWSNLPERYRARIGPTCEQYSIFSDTPYHGGNELDISGMITYAVGDKWLKIGGTLVFLITQSHFQSPSSQGFRNFHIDEHSSFNPLGVDDLQHIRPFPKLANKTAILRLEKVPSDVAPSYPVQYNVWKRRAGTSAAIPEDTRKEAVLARVEISDWEATPVDDLDSPWAILPTGRFALMDSIRGSSDWIVGRKGVTTDLNGVYMVRIVAENAHRGLVQVETRPEAGKRDIGPTRRFWIEPNLLYPLLKGARDFGPCNLTVESDLFVLVPNSGITRSAYEQAKKSVAVLEFTQDYFRTFRKLLCDRSTYRLRQANAPYYAIYNVGSYSFSPYKVVWAEMSRILQAVVAETSMVPLVGDRPYVPDHKIYFASFWSRDEAYFVCAMLNSPLVGEYVGSHTINIQIGNIFKHLELPRFSALNDEHVELSALCSDAHAVSDPSIRTRQLCRLAELSERLLR